MPKYAGLVPLTENLRIRLTDDLKNRWLGLCAQKQISQQDAVISLLEWFYHQDDLVQSMILGQIKPAQDLTETILSRIGRRRGPHLDKLVSDEREGPKKGR